MCELHPSNACERGIVPESVMGNAAYDIASVIASDAKQSISPRKERMDCFVALLLAMTAEEGYRPARGGADNCSVRSRSVMSITVSIGAVSS